MLPQIFEISCDLALSNQQGLTKLGENGDITEGKNGMEWKKN